MALALQAIVKGRFLDASETRSMFTFNITAFSAGVQASILDYLNDFYIAIAPAVSSDWDGYSVEIIELNGFESSPITEIPLIVSGSVGGEMLPHTDAYLIIGKTGKKKTQGKKYIPGVPETMQNGGIVVAGAITDLAAAAAIYVAPGGAGADQVDPGVYNKELSTFEPFTGYRVPNVTATQRRRRQGRGI